MPRKLFNVLTWKPKQPFKKMDEHGETPIFPNDDLEASNWNNQMFQVLGMLSFIPGTRNKGFLLDVKVWKPSSN